MAQGIDSRNSDSPGTGTRPRLRRALRLAALAVACLLAAAAVLAVVMVSVPSLRAGALRNGLRLADDRLPGRLTVEHVAWPGLGRVELAGVTWTDGPDTLASVRRLELAAAPLPLARGRYEIQSVRAEGLRADVPAIRARFAGPAAPVAGAARRPFAADNLPSLGIRDLRVQDARVRLTPSFGIVAPELNLQVDLRRGKGDDAGRASTASLSGRALVRDGLGVALRLEAVLDDSLVVRLAPIHFAAVDALPDPSSLPLDGRLAATLAEIMSLDRDHRWPSLTARGVSVTGELGDLELEGELRGREPGRLRGRLAPQMPPPWLADLVLAGLADSLAVRFRPYLAERWPADAPPLLAWDAAFTPPAPGAGARGLQAAVTGEFVLPGPRDLAPLLPAKLRVADLGALRGRLAADYDGAGDPRRLHLDLDLAGTTWLRAGRVRLDTDTRTWVDVDSLALDLDGLALRAHGRLEREQVDLAAVADVSGALLARWDDPALHGIEGRFHFDVTAVGTRAHPRLRADLNGGATARGLSLPAVTARVRLDDRRLVLGLDAPDGLGYGATALDTLHVDADLRALGGRYRYAGELTAFAGGRHGEIAVPRADLRAVIDDRHAIVDASFPAGLSRGESSVDSARVAFDVTAQDASWEPRAARLQATAAGRHGGLAVPRVDLEGVLDGRRATVTASFPAGLSHGLSVVDSARVAVDLTARESSWQPREARLQATVAGRHDEVHFPRLDLDGSLVDSTVTLALDLPAGLAFRRTNFDSLAFRFAGTIGDSLRRVHGRLEATGAGTDARVAFGADVDVARRDGPPAVHARIDSLGLRRGDRGAVLQKPCELAWDQRDRRLQVTGLDLRGRFGSMAGDLTLTPDQATGDMSWKFDSPIALLSDFLPESLLSVAVAESIAFDGRVRLAGSAASPSAHALSNLEMSDLAGATVLSAHAEGWLRHPAMTPPADWPVAPADAPAQGVSARASLYRNGASILEATARLPWLVSFQPLVVRPDTAEAGEVATRTADLDLSLLDGILPAGNRATGRLDLDLELSGRPEDWALVGRANGRKVVVRFADGSWLNAEGEFGVHGDADSLVATGAVTIGSGLLRVPETPPTLLPATGESMLAVATADTAAASAADTVATAATRRLPLASTAVRLRIPGDLWLRGRGLNVEVAGDLTVKSRGGVPVVQGDLRAMQGSLKIFGNFFTLERGNVIFMEDAALIDPDLDIRLTTKAGDTKCIVQVLGSVQSPQIELSSEPAMSEEDIIATLLFGSTMDELEEGQGDMVSDRAAQVLAVYGSVRLQDWASGQLGLDLVSIEPSAEDESASSLVVGKYLRPDVVVRYEQVMDETSAWYVHLDYLMTSYFKLHSEIFDGGSGLELMLSIDK